MGDKPQADRVVDVAIYGIVNAGKSSLINALHGKEVVAVGPTGGTTTEVSTQPWRAVSARVGPYQVRLIDTPGLEDIGPQLRETVATDAARKADLIVFVMDEDLTASAHAAIEALRAAGKPLLVALNKIDLLGPDDLEAVLASVESRLAALVPPEDVIPMAAAPLERRFRLGDDGQAVFEVVRAAPRIEALEGRLVAAITAAAPELKALSEAAAQVERHLLDREWNRLERRVRAERVADETSVGLALALAVNPVPLLDFLAGSGGLAILVKRVAQVYQVAPSAAAAQHLAADLLRGGRKALWGSLAVVGLGGMMKLLPVVGHVTGALAQAVSAGYVAHVLGRVLVDYYENGCDWGEGGLHAALDRVAAETDRVALTRGLVDRLRARLGEKAPWPKAPEHEPGAGPSGSHSP